MLFCSMTFIYIFLPLLCLIYFLTPKKFRNTVLLVASFAFYMWGEPKFIIIMISTILINYFGALLIDKYQKHKKIFLFLTVSLNLSLLIYFKYFNFLIENINNLFRTDYDFLHIVLPLGISFYTFQALSYTLDVYKKVTKPQINLFNLALYISLFPQLISGPILKYSDIAPQLEDRETSVEKVALGIKRFIIGLSKKVLIANSIGLIADKVFLQQPDVISHSAAWLGVGAYMLQIYYDFSGYSDMAIGLGLIFGFKFMENFNHPYFSKTMTEAWRKWHISLGNWFKNYVFPLRWQSLIPKFLQNSAIWKKPTWFGLKLKKSYINILVVFFLIGLWHGPNWTFIVWGIYNGFLIVFEHSTGLTNRSENLFVNILKHIYMPFVTLLGFVLFRSENLSYALEYYKNMFGIIKPHNIEYTMSYYVDYLQIAILIFAVICCAPIFSKMLETKSNLLKLLTNIWLLVLFVLSTASLAASTYNPFIYFRF